VKILAYLLKIHKSQAPCKMPFKEKMLLADLKTHAIDIEYLTDGIHLKLNH